MAIIARKLFKQSALSRSTLLSRLYFYLLADGEAAGAVDGAVAGCELGGAGC